MPKREDFNKPEILGIAKKVIKGRQICSNCLGRQLAQVSTGMTNRQRGEILRGLLKAKEPKTCSACNGLFKNLGKYAKEAGKKVEEIEFSSFVVGNVMSSELIQKEEQLWEEVGIEHCEPLKSELNRELGKLVQKLLGKEVDEENPNIVIMLNLETQGIEIQIRPLFIYGGYQKLVRGLPQTKWETYKETVEDIIAKPLMKATQASAHALHGCVSPDTEVILENQCVIPIRDLRGTSARVVTVDKKSKKLHVSEVLDYFELEPKKIGLQVFNVRTKETGREITVTEDHEFYTPEGMSAIRKLKQGKQIAVLPHQRFLQPPRRNGIILNEEDIREVIDTYYPSYKFTDRVLQDLKQRGLIPLKADDARLLILARILGFLFGDGNVRWVKSRDISLEFYGQREDLEEIKRDIDILGFTHSPIRTRKSHSQIRDYFGRERVIAGKGTSFLTYSRGIWFLMVALGAPVGNKTVKRIEIPKWVEEGNILMKREFLASLLACEIDKPRMDNREYNKKSFNTPRFSMNKIEMELKNGVEFITRISALLEEFGVVTLNPRLIPYTKRKDGNSSIKIALDFSNRFENLLHLYGNLGFRYCKEKERLSRWGFEYHSMKKNVISKRKALYKKALRLKKGGLQLSRIHKLLGTEQVTKKDLWLWLHGVKEGNIKVPNTFPDFDEWAENATKGLKDGLVWETIESIQKVKAHTMCDITTNPAHTFFANGFLVSNCGREDIDARCLDWRPFVLELENPKKRILPLSSMEAEINRSKKVKVKGLRPSSKKEVRAVKALRPDKSYRVLVSLARKPAKGDIIALKKLVGIIQQKTPTRVLHRRADLLRKRRVKEIKGRILKGRLLLEIKGEAGLYIKELVNGDNGRTTPSVAELLGPAKAEELDVIRIHLKARE